MRTAAIVSTLTFVSIAIASSTPLIPDGISSNCTAFLTRLNSDSSLATCTKNLITTTKAFSPGSSANLTSTALTTTLNTLCTANTTGCSSPAVRTLLTNFYSSCTDELTGAQPNDVVKSLYDILYLFTPLKGAICATDSTSGKYCVTNVGGTTTPTVNGTTTNNGTVTPKVNLAGSSASSALETLEKYPSITVTSGSQKIYTRDSSAQIINSTTWHDTALPYLFLLPSSSASELCTPCGKSILSAYVKWEVDAPYAFGLSQSPVLGGQLDLWNSVSEKCGADFMNAITSTGTGAAPLGAALSNGAVSVGKGSVGVASLVGVVALAMML